MIQNYRAVGIKFHEFVGTGSSPFIDSLVRIPDDKDIAAALSHDADNLPVGGIAVLRLIHLDIIDKVLPVVSCIIESVEYIERKKDQIIEIESEITLLQLEICAERIRGKGIAGSKHCHISLP